MRTRLSRFTLAATAIAALSSAGLALAAPASAAAPPSAVASANSSAAAAAEGWIYWATYTTVAGCVNTGAFLAYPGSPIYAAFYCEEGYLPGRGFFYELFLYKRF